MAVAKQSFLPGVLLPQNGAAAVAEPGKPDQPASGHRPAFGEPPSSTMSLHGTAVAPTQKHIDWAIAGWRLHAACQGTDPDLFFPAGSTGVAVDHTRAAKAVCQSCRVREACLQFALETNQEAGIWGGTAEEERRRLRRTWLLGRRRRDPIDS